LSIATPFGEFHVRKSLEGRVKQDHLRVIRESPGHGRFSKAELTIDLVAIGPESAR
jgi:hypothetical protein